MEVGGGGSRKRGRGMMGIMSAGWGSETALWRSTGGSMREDCRDSTKLDWKEERELVSLDGKSVRLADIGRRQGVADPDLRLRDIVSVYILDKLKSAL